MERAQYLLGNLMAVKPGEEVLIVVDLKTDENDQAMAAAALNCGAEYGVYMMPIRGKDKATIFPKSLELGMDACDVFVGMTTASGAAIYNNHLKEQPPETSRVSICLEISTMVQYNPTVIFDEGTPEEVLIVKRRQGCLFGRQINLLLLWIQLDSSPQL